MSKKTIIISIISVVILALIGGGVVWYVKQGERESVNPPVAENNNQNIQDAGGVKDGESGAPDRASTVEDDSNEEPEVITSDVDTSDWLTYRNEEYGFEVKYPEKWHRRGREGYDFYQFSPDSFESFDGNNDFGIFIEVDNTNVIDKNYEDIILEVFQLESYDYDYITKHKIVLNGQNIMQAKIGDSSINTFLKNDDYLLIIRFVPAGEISTDIYNAFLLTFKFVK